MEIAVYLDKIKDGIGHLILLDGGVKSLWPAELLPKGSKEGDWLSFVINIDDTKEKNELEEMKKLRSELLGE